MLRPPLLVLALLLCCGLAACARAAEVPLAPAPAAPPVPAADSAPHVVIITIDGLRPDAIDDTATPALARMIRDGAATRASLVPKPWLTLPSHFSMVTGQTPARHGILTNKTLRQEPASRTLFNAAHDKGLHTALYIGKYKLIALAPRRSADVIIGPLEGDSYWEEGAPARLASRFAAEFARARYALTFVHLREPDETGHDFGWMSPEYHAAVAEADRALGVVLEAIRISGLTTTVLLTADHGGEGTNHWTHGAVDWTVPWVCLGPGVKAGATIAPSAIVDIGPTAAAILGVSLPDVEGRVVKECLASASG